MTSAPNGSSPPPASGNLSLAGNAAIVAPVSAFQNGGIPNNALIVMPLNEPPKELLAQLQTGAVVVTQEQLWALLGFNGPAVQVQDDQGRPMAIGLEDLLGGLEKHLEEDPSDLNRSRMFAQELLKYERFEKAEAVLSKLVSKGVMNGDDWLALGVSQLRIKNYEKAEATLRGAQNLMKENPLPSLHLAQLKKQLGDGESARAMIMRAIDIAPNAVDAWAQLFVIDKENKGEEAAVGCFHVIRPQAELGEHLVGGAVEQHAVIGHIEVAIVVDPLAFDGHGGGTVRR